MKARSRSLLVNTNPKARLHVICDDDPTDVGRQEGTPPAPPEKTITQLFDAFKSVVEYVKNHDGTFLELERGLIPRVAALGRLLIALYLATRQERLDLGPWLGRDGEKKTFRVKGTPIERTLKTFYGPVVYARTYLLRIRGRGGFHPLDAVLGLTCDGFSGLVMSMAARLSTRVSFEVTTLILKRLLGWSPSTESIERFVLGFGKQAGDYVNVAPSPEGDGEILIIEVDGKATPTATETELRKRRGKRRKEHPSTCTCQRHRGRERRKGTKSKRRKPGDKSKNGRSITLVAMYTLQKGPDGRLHGPINKRIWGTYAPRKAALQWTRAEATRRGFPPDTTKTVEVVVDGEKCLAAGLKTLFPNALYTLDIRHLEEKLWEVGRLLHPKEEARKTWVTEQKRQLYSGSAEKVIVELQRCFEQTSKHGPGTKQRREAVEKLIGYMEPRIDMLQYKDRIEQDLVIASGVIEGACRYVIGERMDCSGMRWIRERAEAMLRLRCLEINDQWDDFFEWTQKQWHQKLLKGDRVQLRTNKLIRLPQAA
jgi:hypothetical protein